MSESVQDEIIRQLMGNAGDIISAVKDDGREKFVALAHRQKHLTESFGKSLLHAEVRAPRASIEALQDFVAKAVEAVKNEMRRNRENMLAAGIKKKVLHAYGTVTVSDR